MFSIISVVAIFYVGFQLTLADDKNPDYVFNYKVTQVFADMVNEIADSVSVKQDMIKKTLTNKSRFNEAAEEFWKLIKKGQRSGCSTAVDMQNLQSYASTFESSWDTCIKEEGCKDSLSANTEKILADLQTIDRNALKKVTKCDDDTCKFTEFHNIRLELEKLYQKSIPGLRLAADDALSHAGCSEKLLECMIKKNENNLKNIYTGIVRVGICLDHA